MNTSIRNASSHQFHQFLVVDAVEAFSDVSFNDPVVLRARLYPAVAFPDTIHRPVSWSEAVRAVQEITFPNRLHEHSEQFLYYSILDRRYS